MGDDFMISDFFGSVTKPPQQEGITHTQDQVQQGSLAVMQPTIVQVRATLLYAARTGGVWPCLPPVRGCCNCRGVWGLTSG